MQIAQTPEFLRAVQLLQGRQLEEAESAIAQLISAHPDKFEPLHLGAIIAFQSGERPEGVTRLRTALQIRPDHAQGLSDLGMMLHTVGELEAAEIALVKALELAPNMAGAHLNLGNVLSDFGDKLRAERHYREALRLHPNLGAALNNLSKLLLGAGKADEALDLARRLIDLAPNSALGHTQAASALDRLGRLEEALATHQKAIALNPLDNGARLSHAGSLAGYGQMEAAIAECRTAITNNPEDATAYGQLAGLIRISDEPELMAKMKELEARQSLSVSARAMLGFALGKAEEQQKNYAAAFHSFETANKQMRDTIRYDKSGFAQVVRDLIEEGTSEPVNERKNVGCKDETPIFIVGMPRSGTTLTEQILCANPMVFGAGEPGILRALAIQAQRDLGISNLSAQMAPAASESLAELGRAYVEQLRTYSTGAERIIDKVPSNFLFIGLIRLSLPNAKIVHCKRAAADTCLSIFKNRFATGSQLFSYNLDELAAYYAGYQELMAHWDEVLPGVVHTVQYERMVSDQEGQSRALFEHCGLEWTDAALSFFKTERPVHTASISQVRQPIYNASSGIAGRYGAAAKPLVEALERAGVDPFAI